MTIEVKNIELNIIVEGYYRFKYPRMEERREFGDTSNNVEA